MRRISVFWANTFRNGGNRWYAAAGKDVAFDKIHRILVALELMVRNSDGLQRHHAVRFQQPAAAVCKKGIQKMVSHRLDHLNGHEFVKSAGQFPVILLQHRILSARPLSAKSSCI